GVLLLLAQILFPRGPRVANDFPLISSQVLKSNFSLPYIWSDKTAEGMGEYAGATLWSWPLNFVSGIFGILNFGFPTIELIFLMVPSFVIAVISVRRVLDKFKIEEPGKSIGTLLYVTTTYFLLLIDGGQLSIALTYAFFPLVFLLFVNSIHSSFKKRIIAALAVSALGFLDLRFVYLLGILIFVHFLYNLFLSEDRKKLFFGYLFSGFISGIVFVLLHLYWILPLVFVRDNLLPPSYDAGIKSFTTLYHSLALLQPNWYVNVFGKISPLRFDFVLIPILVFLAPILKKKDKTVGFWLLVSLISIFLAKGTAPPFGEVYALIYAKVPGFNLFRDSTKFFFLVALSYCVLLAIVVNQISKKVKTAPLFLIFYLLLLVSPVYLGKMTGVFSKPAYQSGYESLNRELENDSQFGRVLWIPSRPPLGYSDLNHPYVEALRMVIARPFAIGRVGDYELFNFLRESPFVGQILKVSSIRYLVYPYPDTRREDLKKDNIDYYHSFLSQISKLPWVEELHNYGSDSFPIPLLKVKDSQDHLYISSNLFGILGSDEIYENLMKVKDFDLSRNALVFLEEKTNASKKFAETFGRIVLYNKSEIDLKGSLVDSSLLLFPSKILNLDPDSSGWWKRDGRDVSAWRNFMQDKYQIDNLDFDYGGGWAIAEGKLKLKLDKLNIQKGDILLARVMKSSRGGKINFIEGGKSVGVLSTKTDGTQKINIKLSGSVVPKFFTFNRASFDWVEVGNLDEGKEIILETEGDINVVNALAVIPASKWSEIETEVKNLRKEGKILEWDKINSGNLRVFETPNTVNLSYKEINPTLYKISVKGITKPVVIAFSETYDNNWHLNNSEGLSLYSLINGFEVEKDGDYILEFAPQKYVDVGLIGTLMGILLVILILILC
ncbi:MAG TPA: hypothetical protein VF185_02820, partial [Patescibacteria group bacterium]